MLQGRCNKALHGKQQQRMRHSGIDATGEGTCRGTWTTWCKAHGAARLAPVLAAAHLLTFLTVCVSSLPRPACKLGACDLTDL